MKKDSKKVTPSLDNKSTQSRDTPKGNDCVILRVRMRRKMLLRIKRGAAWRSEIFEESYSMSDLVKEAMLPLLERIDEEVEAAQSADFSGSPPEAELQASINRLCSYGKTV